jgi:hypothetical protein
MAVLTRAITSTKLSPPGGASIAGASQNRCQAPSRRAASSS